MLRTSSYTGLHPSTKVFEGITDKVKSQAEKFAKEARSYAFQIFIDENVNGKTMPVLYGYGVPA